MAGLQFVMVPGYSAILFRRTFADLKLPGALIDRSREWLTGTGAMWNAQEHRWRFPDGASLQFGYCDHDGDEDRYRSSEFQFIGLDEGTQFTEKQIKFFFSRLRRRIDIPVPLRYRMGTNPGGPSHEFIKRRYIKPGTPGKRFIPAKLADNPHIDRAQYLKSLMELDPLTRAQLLAGDWDAVAGGRFKREWLDACRYTRRGDYYVLRRRGEATERMVMLNQCFVFGTCDPAASSKQTADYTVICAWAVTPDGDLLWLACDRFQAEIPDIVPRVHTFYKQWHLRELGIEAMMANVAVYQLCTKLPMAVVPLNKGPIDKLVHATPGINLVATGRVWLPAAGEQSAGFPGDRLAEVESELTRFTGDDKLDDHNDIVDTLSYSANRYIDGGTPEERNAIPVIMGSGR